MTVLSTVVGAARMTAQIAGAIGDINQVISSGKKAEESLEGIGNSAKVASAEVQKLPGKFAELFGAIQSGQASAGTFLKFGVDLVQSFGGVGAAARGVMSLANPFNAAVQSAILLADAYKEGSKEADHYAKVIALTGNAAGTSVTQLQTMAEGVSHVVGTQAKAAEVLAALAGTGQVASGDLEKFATTAIQMERNVGVSVTDTVKHFAELGASPVEASQKLNAQYGYLTASVYSQIKALKEQGDTLGAAGLAQQTYEKAMANVSKTMEGRLGYFERAWRAVGDAAGWAWDKMLNIGREETPQQKLADVSSRIDTLKDQVAKGEGGFADSGGGAALGGRRSLFQNRRQADLAALQQDQANLQEQLRLDKRGAEAKAQRLQEQKDAQKAEDEVSALQEAGASRKLQREKAIKAYENQIAAIRKGENPSSDALTPEKIAQGYKAIDEKFAVKRAGGSAAAPISIPDSEAFKQYTKSMAEFSTIAEGAVVQTESLSKTQAELRNIQGSPVWVTYSRQQQEQIILAASLAQAGEDSVEAAKEQAKAAQENKKALDDAAEAQRQQTVAAVAAAVQAETELANYGLLKSQVQALTLARLEDARDAARLGGEDVSNLDKRIEAQKRLVAATQGVENAAAKTQAAKEQEQEWKRTSESINKSLTDAFMKSLESGKDFGKNLGNALKEQFKSLVLRPTISAILSPIAIGINSLFGLGGGPSGGSSGGGLGTLLNGAGLVKNIFSLFSGGGALVGNLANGATAFNLASGGGLVSQVVAGVQGALGIGSAATTAATANAMAVMAVPGSPLAGIAAAQISSGGTIPAATAALGNASGAVPAWAMTALKALPIIGMILMGMNASAGAYDQGYRLQDRTALKSLGATLPASFDTMLMQKLGFSERTANIITGGSLVAKVASKLGLQSTAHSGAGAIVKNDVAQEGKEIYTLANFGMGDPREYNKDAQEVVTNIAKNIAGTLDVFFMNFGIAAGVKVGTAFADDISKDGAWGSLRIESSAGKSLVDWETTRKSKWAPREFANGEDGYKQYLNEISRGTVDALKGAASELPAWANRIIAAADTSGNEVDKVVQQLLTDVAAYPNQLLQSAGTSRDELVKMFADGLKSGDAASAGKSVADTLVAALEETLYTQSAGKVFDIINMGIVTPMVDALLTGAALTDVMSQTTMDAVIQRATATATTLNAIFNDPLFAQLLNTLRTGLGSALQGAGGALTYRPQFAMQGATEASVNRADATEASGNLADATDELAQSFKSAVKSLTSDSDSLAVDLLRAKGNGTGAKALEKSQYMAQFAGLDKEDRNKIESMYDANEGTRRAIDVQNERNGLQDELNALTDDATQALTRQRDALDESNRALFDNVQAVKLQKTLAQELPGVLDKYMLPAQRRKAQYDSVAKDLTAAGIDVTADQLANASKGEFAAAAVAVYNLGSTTDDMRLALVRAAGVMADIKDAEVDEAFANLQRVVGLQQEIATKTRDDIKAVFDLLQSSVDELYSSVDSTARMRAAEGQDYIAKTLALAQSGEKIVDSTELGKAISAARSGLDGTQYTSQFERDKERLVLAGKLSDLEEISGEQLSEAERQVKYLDDLVKDGQEQINQLRGLNTGVNDVAGAVKALAEAIGGRTTDAATTRPSNIIKGQGQASFDTTTGQGTTKTGVEFERQAILNAAREVLTAAPDGSGAMSVYNALAAGGYKLSQYNEMFGMPAGTLEQEARKLGMEVFHRGTPFVPRTGFALLQRGEAVIPTAYNPLVHGRSLGDTARLEAHLEKLTGEVMRLQSLQTLGNTHAQATVELLDNVTEGGNGIRAEIMNKVELVA